MNQIQDAKRACISSLQEKWKGIAKKSQRNNPSKSNEDCPLPEGYSTIFQNQDECVKLLLGDEFHIEGEITRWFSLHSLGKGRGAMVSRGGWHPPVDVYETTAKVVVRVELAGVKREEVKVWLEGNTLKISGERYDNSTGEKRVYHRLEVGYGYFECLIHLPIPVERENLQAKYKGGFLEVFLSKVPMKEIPISAG